MSDRVRHADLGITRLLWIFAGLSVLLLALLAIAPVRSHFTEWRTAQTRYNQSASQVGSAPVAVAIKQIWRPELDRVDRCGSCHLGMVDATPNPHEPLFAAHPAMPHEPRDLGCTICHGGQGRATTARAAHGDLEFWDQPMLAPAYTQAGCGGCHSGVVIPADLAAGQSVFERNACYDCHRVDGKGRGDGPDLSYVGIKGFAAGWHDRHVAAAAAASTGAWRTSFAPLLPTDLARVEGFLRSRIGAPRLIAGKALSLSLGCRGCHRIGGVGGDEGPDLGNTGGKVARELDYGGVTGGHTLADWLTQHFLNPTRVVPTSQMPDLGMTREEAELLTIYMLSLRELALPAAQTPPDHVRTVALGERDFSADGGALYGAFCLGCHGPAGAGKRFGVGDYSFPAIGSPEFLAVVDDDLLRATVMTGRPGRKMPAWGTKDGGLTGGEVDQVVAYLRSLAPEAPSFQAVVAAPLDLAAGKRLYDADCRACHGARGQGTALAAPFSHTLDEPDLLEVLVARTPGMGSFAAYPPAALRSLIGFIQTLPATPGKPSRVVAGAADRGAALFAATCAGCHGDRGQGKEGPALDNPAFLAIASDRYLATTIIRGRGDSAMPHFGNPGVPYRALAASEVVDVVAFVRSLAAPSAAKPETRPTP